MTPTPLHWKLSHSYRTLPSGFYSDGQPAGFPDPQLLLFNQPLAQALGLLDSDGDGGVGSAETAAGGGPSWIMRPEQAALRAELAAIFSGNRFPEGARPLSQAYAGHQFGHFAMLGDGRATLLGEQLTPDGQLVDIQLKGSGQTPYSRRGDGKAALGPMLREYLVSEAMHALGIPTTRGLAVVTTGEEIYRGSLLTGAVLTRTAQSHIRVATFQFAAATGGPPAVKALADYTIRRHFPEILAAGRTTQPASQPAANPYQQLLQQIIARQARLVARWQQAGFIHGVMNTDNMAVAGETIDYGPCAFMDTYDPETVFSSIDREGRYRYSNQPLIAQWNLARLAEALLPLLSDDQAQALQLASATLRSFSPAFAACHARGMCEKLGLFPMPEEGRQDSGQPGKPEQADPAAAGMPSDAEQRLVADLLQLMLQHKADFTHTFVRLALTLDAQDGWDGHDLDGTAALFSAEAFGQWLGRWQARLDAQPQGRQAAAARMKSLNPFVIPRNVHVEAVLDAADRGEMAPFHALLAALQQPFNYRAEVRAWQALPRQPGVYRTFCGT